MTSENLQKFHELVAANPEWAAEVQDILKTERGRAARLVVFSVDIGEAITLAEARAYAETALKA